MPVKIVRYEPTPNPNALKCWLDQPLSENPRSFLNAEMAADDPLASRLFEQAGLTTLLINGSWMTINKPPDTNWPTVKRNVESVLAQHQT